MRLLTLSVLSCGLIVTFWSSIINAPEGDPGGLACRIGLCRKDHLQALLKGRQSNTQSEDTEVFKSIVAGAPADGYAWAALAEYVNGRGRREEARVAIDRAVELAPATAPIRMRRLNSCFSKADTDCVLNDGRQVLGWTPDYDGLIFMYYKYMSLQSETVLKLGLPAERRSLRSWALYEAKHAKQPSDVLMAWNRVRDLGFADDSTAGQIAGSLISRGEPAAAWAVWEDCRRHGFMEESSSNRISNDEFTRNYSNSPFDWSVRPEEGVEFVRRDGLEVRFGGDRNVGFANVWQLSYVRSVQHQLVVDVSYEGLTTNQGPFVRLYDVEQPQRLDVKTKMFQGSSARRRIEMSVTVPAGTRLVRLQVQRDRSEKFDNKIAGTLHLHRIALIESAGKR
jgi:hypothetical protein